MGLQLDDLGTHIYLYLRYLPKYLDLGQAESAFTLSFLLTAVIHKETKKRNEMYIK